jgi:secreted PhoX family phosphatase
VRKWAVLQLSIAASIVFLIGQLAHSQSLTVTTLAGNAGQGSADGSGSSARFSSPGGVAVDSTGNLYVADTANHTIRKITSAGTVSTLAGLAGASGSANGTGSAARFNQPQGVAVDTNGIVYVADTGNHSRRRSDHAGRVRGKFRQPQRHRNKRAFLRTRRHRSEFRWHSDLCRRYVESHDSANHFGRDRDNLGRLGRNVGHE